VAPEEIKTLRKELACTARELAAALGVEQATVFAWERGELFPTKRYVDRMTALRTAGPLGVPRRPTPPSAHGRSSPTAPAPPSPPNEDKDPLKRLADPLFWEIVRKIVAHTPLRNEVARLAAAYPDPATSSSRSATTAAPVTTGPPSSGASDAGGSAASARAPDKGESSAPGTEDAT
jgi:transcriptional regulator with XRE-family HTH domain